MLPGQVADRGEVNEAATCCAVKVSMKFTDPQIIRTEQWR